MLSKVRFALCAAALMSISSMVHAQPQIPFSTTSVNYVYMGVAGMNNSPNSTYIYTSPTAATSTINFANGTLVTGSSYKINGIGLNQQDGFLYGIAFPNNAGVATTPFYRIGANGVAKQLGSIPAPLVLGASMTFINTTAGFVDANGTYWFSAYVYTGNPTVTPYDAQNLKFYLGKLPNVAAMTPSTTLALTPTYHEISYQADLNFRTGVQSFLDNFNYSNPGSSNGGFEDLALNPADGKVYTYYSYPNPNNPSQLLHRPAVINPTNWTANTVGTVTNTTPNREIAGAYFDVTNNFYILFTDAQYAKVNLTTGGLSELVASSLPVATNVNLRGDLASNLVNAAPLPVRLETFEGHNDGSVNVLQWTSELEENMSGYDVERSDDGAAFAAIGYVPATGKGGNYRYEDARGGSAVYRLSIRNIDGATELSKSVRIAGNSADNSAVMIYPTLVQGNELSIRATGEFQVRVVDADGRLVSTATGNGELNLPFAVTPGQYFVTVSGPGGEQRATVRVVKQ